MASVISSALEGISQLCGVTDKARAISIAGKAVQEIGLPWTKVKAGHWYVTAPENHGFVVFVEVLAYEDCIACVASASVIIAREWITRELAISLLQESCKFMFGSVRLNDTEKGMDVCVTHFLRARFADSKHVAEVCFQLAVQTQEMLTRLYARDLILQPQVSR